MKKRPPQIHLLAQMRGSRPLKNTNGIVSDSYTECNLSDEEMESIRRKMQRIADPRYLNTMSLDEILNNVYMSKSAVVDGLLSSGVYILAGEPKIGKSFLVHRSLFMSAQGKNFGTMRYIRVQSFILPWKMISAAYSRECHEVLA